MFVPGVATGDSTAAGRRSQRVTHHANVAGRRINHAANIARRILIQVEELVWKSQMPSLFSNVPSLRYELLTSVIQQNSKNPDELNKLNPKRYTDLITGNRKISDWEKYRIRWDRAFRAGWSGFRRFREREMNCEDSFPSSEEIRRLQQKVKLITIEKANKLKSKETIKKT